MANLDKRKAKLKERIHALEEVLRLSLKKKSSSAAEIDMAGKTREIARLRQELKDLH